MNVHIETFNLELNHGTKSIQFSFDRYKRHNRTVYQQGPVSSHTV